MKPEFGISFESTHDSAKINRELKKFLRHQNRIRYICASSTSSTVVPVTRYNCSVKCDTHTTHQY